MSSAMPASGIDKSSPPRSRLGFVAAVILGLSAASACTPIELARVEGAPPDVRTARGTAGPATGRERSSEARAATAAPTADPTPRPRRRAKPTPGASEGPSSAAASEKPTRRERDLKVLRLKPRPKRGPFEMNLYREGDFVHQQTKDWCVAGSAQTMLNIMSRGRPDRSAAFQRRLYQKGRRLSPKARLGPIGVDLLGWARLLDSAGHGPYVVDGARTRYEAIKKAAKALRMTGRPVGLAVWRGAHSWVMSGFKATADPAITKDFRVTAVYIQDVWYPYVSSIWGASRPPNSLVPVSRLREDFLPYRRPLFRHPDRDGRFMIVKPELPRNTVVR